MQGRHSIWYVLSSPCMSERSKQVLPSHGVRVVWKVCHASFKRKSPQPFIRHEQGIKAGEGGERSRVEIKINSTQISEGEWKSWNSRFNGSRKEKSSRRQLHAFLPFSLLNTLLMTLGSQRLVACRGFAFFRIIFGNLFVETNGGAGSGVAIKPEIGEQV